MISVQQLTKKFGRQVAVDSLTFEVQKGEVLGFLGPNGAGKTTTMRMVTGYLPPSGGRVRIDGYDLYDHPIEVKRRIGYLPENPPVYPELTVRQYLEFVAEIKDVPVSRRKAAVDRALERAQLQEVRDKRVGKLSKGFKQRVGLGQAIVHEPPVLILDEPTSSLDPKQRVEVRHLISQLKGEHTVILSTHILPEVSEIADRVFIINRGRVMAVDSPANLSDRLRAREMVTVQLRIPGRVGPGDSGKLCEEVRSAFAALQGVGDITVQPDDDAVTVKLESAVGVDLRPEVAPLVVGRGWQLLGLAADSLSLEQIFLTLVSDENEEARLPPSRAERASASLAEAFGEGGKPRTTSQVDGGGKLMGGSAGL
ncbi:MAG: ABC transporter ATP-binding protein [Acidobacteria bacterium]|nr:ABC transporter ATP-binding protein [Acidobacteriota bacterium]